MYVDDLKKALDKTDFTNLDEIVDAINRSNLIAIIGNGGSASTAEHMACDLNNLGYNAIPLTTISTITAIANDFGYDEIYSKQIKISEPDLVIAISASGNSPNIIKAIKTAKKMGCITLGLCGFNGGKLKKLADYRIYVPINNYEIVEDIHLIISHMIKCELKK